MRPREVRERTSETSSGSFLATLSFSKEKIARDEPDEVFPSFENHQDVRHL